MGQLVGFFLHPPLSEIAKKLGKMLKYTPTFKVLSAPPPGRQNCTSIVNGMCAHKFVILLKIFRIRENLYGTKRCVRGRKKFEVFKK